jgi:prevent-host-death family protein
MKPIQISEDILPLAKFKARASEIIRRLHAVQRPIVITQNGRPAAVLITPEQFDELSERERLVTAIREGLSDAETDRVIDDEALSKDLDAALGPVTPE